ncbi:MAG: NAD(P)-dependent oxidoreductase, partial [Phycisphaerae bacterium]
MVGPHRRRRHPVVPAELQRLHRQGSAERARRQQNRAEWRRFAPTELTNKTVTIVGVGAIGSRIAERLNEWEPLDIDAQQR